MVLSGVMEANEGRDAVEIEIGCVHGGGVLIKARDTLHLSEILSWSM